LVVAIEFGGKFGSRKSGLYKVRQSFVSGPGWCFSVVSLGRDIYRTY
jgi:hypothetical protein